MRAAFAFAALVALCACEQRPATQQPLVGAWRLERYVDTPEGGAPVYAFGEHPIGLFVFSADGHASISMMRNPPEASAVADPDPDACVPDWYCSYFGTYTVEPSVQAWSIHVEGGNIPSFIGTDQTRAFLIEGDGNRMTMTDAYRDENGRIIRTERVLVRASGAS